MKFRLGLLAVGLSVYLAACSDSADPPGKRLVAIIDAGSSGSRLYLYQADPGVDVPQLQVLMTNRDAQLALSSFDGVTAPASDAGPQGVGPLLSALDAYLAAQGVPKSQLTVHALGTAGMRLLTDSQSQSIYSSVARTIAAMGYRTGRTETISGQMEAAYSWVDVNYLLGNFRAGQQTKGIVEVGGASSQVAFAARDATRAGTQNFRINGTVYPVFTVSYLGLGQNEARRSMIADPASGGTERSVCYPNNTADAAFLQYDAGFAGLTMKANTSAFGAGCAQVYQSVIAKSGAGVGGAPSVSQLAGFQEMQGTRFVGVSSIYYAFNDWKVLDAANPADAFRDKVTQTCTGPDSWTRVRAQYGGSASVFAQNACANATFIHTLLFSDSALRLSSAQISAVSDINGQSLSWTRGAALLEAISP